MAHEDGPEDGHRNFYVIRRLNRIEVEAVANGKYAICLLDKMTLRKNFCRKSSRSRIIKLSCCGSCKQSVKQVDRS
jgi:hypothetical protein